MEHTSNKVEFSFADLAEAFPECDTYQDPAGSRILVQVRMSKKITAGGVHLIQEVRDTEQANTQIAKLVAVGPLAFRNRTTGVQWPEGAWAEIGAFIRIPRYGGDRFNVQSGEDEITFVFFNDLDVVAIARDPLKIKAFL